MDCKRQQPCLRQSLKHQVGSSTNPNYSNPTAALMLYEQGAWLVSQFVSHTSDYVSLQYALWDLMSPGAEPTSYQGTDDITVSQWLSWAAANYKQINPANFEIITNVGPLEYNGPVQEFIVQTLEPATVVLVLFGIGDVPSRIEAPAAASRRVVRPAFTFKCLRASARRHLSVQAFTITDLHQSAAQPPTAWR
jgi:hypothetical protein